MSRAFSRIVEGPGIGVDPAVPSGELWGRITCSHCFTGLWLRDNVMGARAVIVLDLAATSDATQYTGMPERPGTAAANMIRKTADDRLRAAPLPDGWIELNTSETRVELCGWKCARLYTTAQERREARAER